MKYQCHSLLTQQISRIGSQVHPLYFCEKCWDILKSIIDFHLQVQQAANKYTNTRRVAEIRLTLIKAVTHETAAFPSVMYSGPF